MATPPPDVAAPFEPVPRSSGRAAPVPLTSVIAFTFFNSLGTGALTNGVYFLTDSAYEFSRMRNFALGIVLGFIYVGGALGVGPALDRRRGFLRGVSTRAVILAVMLTLTAVCALPRVVAMVTGERVPPEWTVWVVLAMYGLLTGALWPMVESYMSGGRRGRALRRATGLFNIFWSAALIAAFWGMSPLMSMGRALDVILILGVVHIGTTLLLIPWGPEPPRHVEEHHEPHPPVYRDLLIVFRWLLPTSYVVLSTLSPLLPTLMEDVGASIAWATPLAATWMTARVLTFIGFERWHGWHGRWWVAVVGLCGLLGSFALCLFAPRAGDFGMGVMLMGLAGFGASQALIYLGALYYAMEVGAAAVDAGGMHEALIGLGYTIGPVCGFAVGLIIAPTAPHFEGVLLVSVFLIVLVVCGLTGRQILRRSNHRANHGVVSS